MTRVNDAVMLDISLEQPLFYKKSATGQIPGFFAEIPGGGFL
jgi:hypothetical protein